MHGTRQLIGRSLAAGLLALHLLVVTMALSPALHHWLHGDSESSDHQCAVTAMSDGQLDRPEAAAVAVAQPGIVLEILDPAGPARIASARALALPGERAPPCA